MSDVVHKVLTRERATANLAVMLLDAPGVMSDLVDSGSESGGCPMGSRRARAASILRTRGRSTTVPSSDEESALPRLMTQVTPDEPENEATPTGNGPAPDDPMEEVVLEPVSEEAADLKALAKANGAEVVVQDAVDAYDDRGAASITDATENKRVIVKVAGQAAALLLVGYLLRPKRTAHLYDEENPDHQDFGRHGGKGGGHRIRGRAIRLRCTDGGCEADCLRA